MSEIPKVTYSEAAKAFEKAGFVFARKGKGSHRIYKKMGYLYHFSIPDHGSKILGTGLIKSLIGSAGLTVEEFVENVNS